MLLEKFTGIEKEIFLKKFLFFATRKNKAVEDFEKSIMPALTGEAGEIKREPERLEVPVPIHRKFPKQNLPMGVRYIKPKQMQRIQTTMPLEQSVLNPLMVEQKYAVDVSEKIPQSQEQIEDRRLVISEEELHVPVPRRLEGRREPPVIKLGQRQPQFQGARAEIINPTIFNKFAPFMNDLSITSIECSAGENILVSRGNEKMSTQMILSDQEVKEFITEFSQRTRIPLTEFFKAALGDWQINSIMSDVVSPRFILTRAAEFRKLGNFSSQIQQMPEQLMRREITPEFRQMQASTAILPSITESEEIPAPSD